jgi:hypothetical protein
LAGGRTVETTGRSTSAFGFLTAIRAFLLFLLLTIFFFFDETAREDFSDFFLTLAGGLDLNRVGDS